ncbi:hypothetical protein AB0C10_16010 [Microbispora amethystogenes]|uniref:hypothetical protein n=1 Tax=Microbispora amethystogenes TaxID=1427754 RepID=UPI0033E62B29
MKVLGPLLVVAVLATATVVIVWLLTRVPEARRNKKALDRYRELVSEIHAAAIEASDVDQFAIFTAEKIRLYLTNPSIRKVNR